MLIPGGGLHCPAPKWGAVVHSASCEQCCHGNKQTDGAQLGHGNLRLSAHNRNQNPFEVFDAPELKFPDAERWLGSRP